MKRYKDGLAIESENDIIVASETVDGAIRMSRYTKNRPHAREALIQFSLFPGIDGLAPNALRRQAIFHAIVQAVYERPVDCGKGGERTL